MAKKLYRVLRNIKLYDKPVVVGELVVLSLSPEKEKLLTGSAGSLAEVHSPPIKHMAHWEKVAAKLAKLQIVTISDLLMADTQRVADKTGETERSVEMWKKALQKFIVER